MDREFTPPVHEQFTAFKTTLFSTGIQSRLVLGEINGVSVIRKTAGSELTPETLSSLVTTIPAYRQSLIDAGLLLPENLSVRICDGLELIDKYIEGKDIDVMIQMKDQGVQQSWTEMVLQICKANSGTNYSKAMIDAKPANFVMSGDTLFYVDLFPPMLRDAHGLITPWIPEVFKREHHMMSFNFGDTRGQITKLLAGSRLTYPRMYEYLREWTLDTLNGNIPSQITEYIKEQSEQGFPDMNLFYSGQDSSKRMEELEK
jgi:hypothetical protein